MTSEGSQGLNFDIDEFGELRSFKFSVQRHEKNENQRISYAVELQVIDWLS